MPVPCSQGTVRSYSDAAGATGARSRASSRGRRPRSPRGARARACQRCRARRRRPPGRDHPPPGSGRWRGSPTARSRPRQSVPVDREAAGEGREPVQHLAGILACFELHAHESVGSRRFVDEGREGVLRRGLDRGRRRRGAAGGIGVCLAVCRSGAGLEVAQQIATAAMQSSERSHRPSLLPGLGGVEIPAPSGSSALPIRPRPSERVDGLRDEHTQPRGPRVALVAGRSG